MTRHRKARAKLHAWRPSVLLPESLEATLERALASCPFGAGAQPVSPEFIRAVVAGPERLRALRLRQRTSRFFHRAPIIQLPLCAVIAGWPANPQPASMRQEHRCQPRDDGPGRTRARSVFLPHDMTSALHHRTTDKLR